MRIHWLVGEDEVVNVAMQPLRDEEAITAFLRTKQKFMVQWRSLADMQEPTKLPMNLVCNDEKLYIQY